MWRKAKWKPHFPVKLAPPTPTSAVDGWRYHPKKLGEGKAPIPGVPQGPRLNSAKKVMNELEARRVAKMTPALLNNPEILVAALIERLPVVQMPFKSWQLDFSVVQAKVYDDYEKKIPKPVLQTVSVANPPWVLDVFKEAYRYQSDTMLEFTGTKDAPSADSISLSSKDSEAKNEKVTADTKKSKSKKSKSKKEGTESQSMNNQEEKKVEKKKSKDDDDLTDGWKKQMVALGIEFADDKIEKIEFEAQISLENQQQKVDTFNPLPRTTEADRKNDTRSLDRKLYSKLFLVIKRKGKWGFPNIKIQQKEGLLQCAERAASTIFHPEKREGDLYFISSAPCGYRAGDGAKEFFLRAQLINGGFSKEECPQPIEDYQWLTADEVGELLYGPNGDQDEILYFKRMIGDDWWDTPDDDKMSPVQDKLSMTKVKDMSEADIIKRTEEELSRRKEILKSLLN